MPTDEELKNLPKDSRTFDCVICLETVPLNAVYTFNCDHQICCPCARNLTSKYCPFCRGDISSSTMTKKKIEEIEAKFSQLDEDEEFARNLQAQINGEIDVGTRSENDDDVVFIETKKSVSTEVTTKKVFHRKGNLKDDTGSKSQTSKRARVDNDSRDAAKKAHESDDEYIDF